MDHPRVLTNRIFRSSERFDSVGEGFTDFKGILPCEKVR